MAKLYVPEGVWLACNRGTSPSTLRVSNHENTTIYSQPLATEADKLPFFNIKPMGICLMKGGMCMPVVMQWDDPKEGVKINGNRMLLENSTCKCAIGGKVTIHFDRESAVAAGIGPGKMPSEYIKEGFDWLAEKTEQERDVRDSSLSDWMKPVAHVQDWFNDLDTGLVEGAIDGVVGLGETIYQVAQDPVGTVEAVGGMISDGWDATKEGTGKAWDWASDGDNWSNAAEGAWNWASDGDNWKNAASGAWEGTKDAAGWVANNPRKIGNTVGEFIPDAAAAYFTAGSSLAATGGKVALREGGEAVVKKVGKEIVEEVGEKAVKEVGEKAVKEGIEEIGEAAAKKTARETLEAIGKKEADDIAKVVTKDADEIIEAGGKKGGWNKALNGELKPNSIYDVDGYKYHTDDLGRVTKVEGDLNLSPRGRNNYQQGKSVDIKDGINGDQGGHLIGDRFNGPGEQINYVPQKGSLNQGAYKSMENEWDRALQEGKSVQVKIKNIYDGSSKRPIGQQVDYWVDGVKESKTFVN